MASFINKVHGGLGKSSIMKDERGLSTVEYVVLLVLIVAASVGLWVIFGGAIHDKLTQVNGTMGEVKY